MEAKELYDLLLEVENQERRDALEIKLLKSEISNLLECDNSHAELTQRKEQERNLRKVLALRQASFHAQVEELEELSCSALLPLLQEEVSSERFSSLVSQPLQPTEKTSPPVRTVNPMDLHKSWIHFLDVVEAAAVELPSLIARLQEKNSKVNVRKVQFVTQQHAPRTASSVPKKRRRDTVLGGTSPFTPALLLTSTTADEPFCADGTADQLVAPLVVSWSGNLSPCQPVLTSNVATHSGNIKKTLFSGVGASR